MSVIRQIMSRVSGGRRTGGAGLGRRGTGTGMGGGVGGGGMGGRGTRRSQDEAIGRGLRGLFRRFR